MADEIRGSVNDVRDVALGENIRTRHDTGAVVNVYDRAPVMPPLPGMTLAEVSKQVNRLVRLVDGDSDADFVGLRIQVKQLDGRVKILVGVVIAQAIALSAGLIVLMLILGRIS